MEWNTDQGYGFLLHGGDRWFLHMRSFAARDVIPAAGDRVLFVPGLDPRGRSCATGAVLIPRKLRRLAENGLSQVLLLLLPALVIMALPLFAGSIAVILGSLSLLTYNLYLRDKQASIVGKSRVPESLLQLLEFAGGWPGALFAQHRLRHKTSKAVYQRSFWKLILCHQLLAFCLILIASGVWQAVLWQVGSLMVASH